jgi:hypothetical protein
MSLDSSILISPLAGDSHKDEVLLKVAELHCRKAEVFLMPQFSQNPGSGQ